MNFISFVKQNHNQKEEALKNFSETVINDKNFPDSSDPRILGKYLYLKLNHQQTLGFQKWMMIYKTMDTNNELPKELNDEQTFLNAINYIVFLQNNDTDYKNF